MPLRERLWNGTVWQVLTGPHDSNNTTPREDLVRGTYIPSISTTGITSQLSELTVQENGITYNSSSNGQTIENTRFRGLVNIQAQNLTFKNCYFEGPATRLDTVIVIMRNNSVRDIVFEDCTFRPRFADRLQHVMSGHGFTLRRCDVSGGVDGVSVIRYTDGDYLGQAAVVIEDCWIHDLAFFSPDSTHSDNMTHNDVIQWHGGTGLTVIGNRLDGYYDVTIGNATDPNVDSGATHVSGNHWPISPLTNKYRAMSILMISPGNGTHGNLVFQHNWLNGGAVGINAGGSPDDFLTNDGSTIDHNWAGLDWRLVDDNSQTYSVVNSYAFYLKSNHAIPVTDNYLWDEDNPFQTAIANNTRKNA